MERGQNNRDKVTCTSVPSIDMNKFLQHSTCIVCILFTAIAMAKLVTKIQQPNLCCLYKFLLRISCVNIF